MIRRLALWRAQAHKSSRAAEEGDAAGIIEVLQWLRANGCPLDKEDCVKRVERYGQYYGELDALDRKRVGQRVRFGNG
jgi:hypothetical protein